MQCDSHLLARCTKLSKEHCILLVTPQTTANRVHCTLFVKYLVSSMDDFTLCALLKDRCSWHVYDHDFTLCALCTER